MTASTDAIDLGATVSGANATREAHLSGMSASIISAETPSAPQPAVLHVPESAAAAAGELSAAFAALAPPARSDRPLKLAVSCPLAAAPPVAGDLTPAPSFYGRASICDRLGTNCQAPAKVFAEVVGSAHEAALALGGSLQHTSSGSGCHRDVGAGGARCGGARPAGCASWHR